MVSSTVSEVPPDIQDWPPEGLERVKLCPACGSSCRKALYQGLTDRVFFCAPGRWNMYLCQGCGSAYLDPRPTPETIQRAYDRYFTHVVPGRTRTSELAFLRRGLRALANGYRNYRYGADFQPACKVGAIAIHCLPAYRRAMDLEMRHLPRVWPNARLLDVGCGSGVFLQHAKKVGWQVVGADPDPGAVATARSQGLQVRLGGIEAFKDSAVTFDAITLNHVIEHVHNPEGTLRQALALLKPGGYLYVDTPNADSLGHKEFGEYWKALDVPRHLTLFSWRALESMLERLGFEAIERHCRSDPYPKNAAASRAIRDRKDPYEHMRIRVQDRLKGTLFYVVTHFNYRQSEFITLLARKSELSKRV